MGHSIREFEEGYEVGRRLLAFRSECGFVTATWGLVCPRCGVRDLAELPLSGEGRIAAFTVQTVPSEEFVNDAPYAYVTVDLPEGGRITGWMAGVRTEEELSIGDSVHFAPGYRRGVQFERGSGASRRD
ncbi:MAG: OB-fold domain-containing protein [Thermoplasmata archaeon]|nr:OB-fold domain-containing protein [Thermoplasmata archaeon]MCI4359992.1 OB-fold domain-containing protein [Thermoplasmata archaeon]